MSKEDETKGDAREDATEQDSQSSRAPSKSRSTSDDESRGSSAASADRSSKSPAKKSPAKAKGGASRGAAKSSAKATPWSLALAGIVILALGGVGGWFAHVAHAKNQLRKEAGAEGSESCSAWQQAICSERGKQSAACQQAKKATDLLTTSACDVALETVPASISKMKAARASCDELETKLCGDLSKGSPACKLVKDQTPSFPPSKCKAMLGKYDQVLSELKMVESRMGQRGMGGPPMGGPRQRSGPAGAKPPSQGAVPLKKAVPPQGATPTPPQQ